MQQNIHKNKILRLLCLMLCISSIILFTPMHFASCGRNALKDRFGYTDKSFEIAAEGQINGIDIAFHATNSQNADNSIFVIYLEYPSHFNNIIISIYDNNVSVRLRDTMVEHDIGSQISVEPFSVLFERREPTSIIRADSESVEINVTDEKSTVIYLFEDDAEYPYKISGTADGMSFAWTITEFRYISESS